MTAASDSAIVLLVATVAALCAVAVAATPVPGATAIRADARYRQGRVGEDRYLEEARPLGDLRTLRGRTELTAILRVLSARPDWLPMSVVEWPAAGPHLCKSAVFPLRRT